MDGLRAGTQPRVISRRPREMSRAARIQNRSRHSRASAQARAWGVAPPCAQQVYWPRIAHALQGVPSVR